MNNLIICLECYGDELSKFLMLMASLSLTHWGWMAHIYVGKLTIIGSDNGFSPKQHQAIIWTNGGILLIGPLGTNFGEILIAIQTFSLKKRHLKLSSAKWRPFCLGLNVLSPQIYEFVLFTYWGLNKMVNILETTFSNVFSWMKIIAFWFKFHWSLFIRVQLTNDHCFREWLGAKKRQAITWTNDDPAQWC